MARWGSIVVNLREGYRKLVGRRRTSGSLAGRGFPWGRFAHTGSFLPIFLSASWFFAQGIDLLTNFGGCIRLHAGSVHESVMMGEVKRGIWVGSGPRSVQIQVQIHVRVSSACLIYQHLAYQQGLSRCRAPSWRFNVTSMSFAHAVSELFEGNMCAGLLWLWSRNIVSCGILVLTCNTTGK